MNKTRDNDVDNIRVDSEDSCFESGSGYDTYDDGEVATDEIGVEYVPDTMVCNDLMQTPNIQNDVVDKIHRLSSSGLNNDENGGEFLNGMELDRNPSEKILKTTHINTNEAVGKDMNEDQEGSTGAYVVMTDMNMLHGVHMNEEDNVDNEVLETMSSAWARDGVNENASKINNVREANCDGNVVGISDDMNTLIENGCELHSPAPRGRGRPRKKIAIILSLFKGLTLSSPRSMVRMKQ